MLLKLYLIFISSISLYILFYQYLYIVLSFNYLISNQIQSNQILFKLHLFFVFLNISASMYFFNMYIYIYIILYAPIFYINFSGNF